MNEIKAYDGFVLFSALKLHFTSNSYDYFKYHGKIKSTPTHFSINKDRFKYQKLVRLGINSKEELTDYIIANIIEGKKWIGEFLDDDAMENHIKRKAYKESLSYHFKNETEIISGMDKPFSIKKGEYPKVLEAYMHGKISLETFILLDYFIQFFPKFDKHFGTDDLIWSPIKQLATKYKPFLKFNGALIENIMVEKFLTK